MEGSQEEAQTSVVPLRELNNASRIAERIEAGNVLIVTKNGMPIMRIEPYNRRHEPAHPFRTDPMADELDDMPVLAGPTDLSTNPAHLKGFGR
ncbi:antitoxin (DNA-binding transcriptional repressor) of toxin-antitoxin stability system [Streptacidiphilus sp. MAP12-20]|uniref:type II toxin-antitoxin system Phd/YefM family antitoxin n=1 Tax=Streptacidiphilus sp. MAP12-20 TaxID=3156299 RepID=UPI0035112026